MYMMMMSLIRNKCWGAKRKSWSSKGSKNPRRWRKKNCNKYSKSSNKISKMRPFKTRLSKPSINLKECKTQFSMTMESIPSGSIKSRHLRTRYLPLIWHTSSLSQLKSWEIAILKVPSKRRRSSQLQPTKRCTKSQRHHNLAWIEPWRAWRVRSGRSSTASVRWSSIRARQPLKQFSQMSSWMQ